METNKFVNKYRAISNRINRLHDQRSALVNQYYDENMPDWHGKILEIHFADGLTLKGASVYEPELNKETGEFRPNLNRYVRRIPKQKRIYYDFHKKIDHIDVIGSLLTCSDCGFRVLKDDKMYCKLIIDGKNKSYMQVSPDKIACSSCSHVVWKDNIPWKTKEIMKEEGIKL